MDYYGLGGGKKKKEWMCPLQIHTRPEPRNVTLFVDVMTMEGKMKSSWIRRPTSNHCVLMRKEEAIRDPDTRQRGGPVKAEAETVTTWPQAKERKDLGQPPEAVREAWNRRFTRSLQKGPILRIP